MRRIYIIGAVGTQKVKIGVCGYDAEIRHPGSDVIIRMRTMQCGSPLELQHIVDFVDHPKLTEREIHRLFWECHSHGEWFNLCPRLQKFIEQMKLEEGAVVGRQIHPLRNKTIESQKKIVTRIRERYGYSPAAKAI